MQSSSPHPRCAARRRALGAMAVLGVALACACSGSSFRSLSESSRKEAKATAAATPTAAPRQATAAPSSERRAEAESAEPAPPDPQRPRPVLTPELHRLRHAAQQDVLGRASPPGPYALAYAPFDAVQPPARGTASPADESGTAPSALGNFVPFENEGALRHFHDALARLVAGSDDDGKVRILAYGASHTQADTYTGYLRAYLQKRFGDGGQGFVLLGRVNKWYRTNETSAWHRGMTVHHARYKLEVQDEPLGLFGAALVGRYGASYGEIITAKSSPNTRFELYYSKARGGGDFSIEVDGKVIARVATKSEAPALGCHRFEASPGRHRIRAQLRGNGPVRLFGVTAETATPGVVVDTLGIGGSQMISNLRWSEDSWIEALRQRKPDLVTFAYGTNEAMDESNTLESYARELRAVVARMQKATPGVSCVLMAPFDLPARAQGPLSTRLRLLKIIQAQRRISKELGCGFWDGYAFMGGQGSMHRWVMARPPLASNDYIHLTRLGYVYVGIGIGDALMRAYDLDASQAPGRDTLARPSGASP